MTSYAERFIRAACAPASALALLLLLALSSMQGCGGGTTGTGGTGSSQFSGRISTFAGEPVAGANVILEETGDTAVSDSQGNFDIESVLPGDVATFLVETSAAQASTALSNIPPGPHDVTVELKLDEKKNTVTIQSQTIAPPKKPRKTPTPRPKPTKMPTPAPTAVVDPTLPVPPTDSPLPTPSTTPTPELTLVPVETVKPVPVETVVPEAPNLTVFRGSVSGDPALLQTVRLGLVGSVKRVKIQTDGTFLFRASVLTSLPLLEAVSGGVATQVALDEVTASAQKVILKLAITAKSAGGVTVSINSSRIIE